jgi:uncharacterized protein YfaS (alpha-2-macroglobulin family)
MSSTAFHFVTRRNSSLLGGVVAVASLLTWAASEERPVGVLSATVVMGESGKPLPNAEVALFPALEQDRFEAVFQTRTDDRGAFTLRGVPEGLYEIDVSGRAHRASGMMVHVVEGMASQVHITAEPIRPYLTVSLNVSVVPPGREPPITVEGFLPGDEYTVELHRLPPDWHRRSDAASLAWTFANGWYVASQALPDGVERFLSEQRRAVNRDAEGVFADRLRFPNLSEGLYFVTVTARVDPSFDWADSWGYSSSVITAEGVVRQVFPLAVSRFGLVMKDDGERSLFFATAIESGEPMPDVVVFAASRDASVRQVGVTREDGMLSVPHVGRSDGVACFGMSGESVALVNMWEQSDGRMFTTFFYTDRPIYRPGEEIQFKGIVREMLEEDYSVPANMPVEIRVYDADYAELLTLHAVTSATGSFDGSFKTNSEVSPGTLVIETEIAGATQTHYVALQDFEKPMYSVTVTPTPRRAIGGDRVTIEVKGEYYFGAPAVGAHVEAYVYRRPLYPWESESNEEAEDEYWFQHGAGFDDGGEWVTTMEARADERGMATFTFPTALADEDYRYQVHVWLSDEGGGSGDGEVTFDVLRSAVRIEAKQEEYILRRGQSSTVRARLVGLEGKPVANAEMEVEVAEIAWRRSHRITQNVKRSRVRTGHDGWAAIEVVPQMDESLQVTLVARDQQGRRTSELLYYYVHGGSWISPDSTALELILDKARYSVGDTCVAAIHVGTPGGSALVTVEGHRLYHSRVVEVASEITLVEIPVEAVHLPNAFVTVSRIYNGRPEFAEREMLVDPTVRKLFVSVEPQKNTAKPGERVPIRVRTLDDQGRPVSAEVTLTVVDEAIYSVVEDTKEILQEFYPVRYNAVSTACSIVEAFLDSGAKSGGELPIRKEFKDTAAWFPTIRTDENGEATVAVTAPDNLTTWRCTAVAATERTEVGKAKAQFRVTLPLSVQISAPEMVVEGDRVRLSAAVRNETGRAQEVAVRAIGSALSIEGEATQSLRVENGESRTLIWWARVDRGLSGSFTVTAQSAGGSDGMTQQVNIQPRGTWRVEHKSSFVEEQQWSEDITFIGERNDVGELEIRFTPSLVAALSGSLDDLIDFPYGCAEQTLSRFLPALAVNHALNALGLPPPPRASLIPEITEASLHRLKRMQSGEGGWGWWEQDDPDPWMTAIVLEGLGEARRFGVSVDPTMITRASDWAVEQVRSRRWSESERIYLAYAASMHVGRSIRELLGTLEPRSASDYARLAMAWFNAGEQMKATEAIEKMKSLADAGGRVARWSGGEHEYGQEATALCLRAMLLVTPDAPLVEAAVRGLLSTRKGSSWTTTRETAYVILALTDFLAGREVAVEPMTVRVLVNGVSVQSASLIGAELGREMVVKLPARSLRKGQNTVTIERSRPSFGACALTVREVTAQAPPSPSGLIVRREFYTLQPTRMMDGSLMLRASREPVHRFEVGDVVACEIDVDVDNGMRWVQVDVPVPSNLRVMEPFGETWVDGWTMVWNRRVVSLFRWYLPPGTHTFTVRFRATSGGTAVALPTVLFNMYEPGVRAYSSQLSLEVR